MIRILSPGNGEAVSKSPVEIRYAVRSPSGDPVTAVEVKVDGRPAKQPGPALDDLPPGTDGERQGRPSVPLGINATITVVARSGE